LDKQLGKVMNKRIGISVAVFKTRHYAMFAAFVFYLMAGIIYIVEQ
jgi:hypothetical protein